MAGAEGLEPTNGGIKTRCLTTWRRPYCFSKLLFVETIVSKTQFLISVTEAVCRAVIDLHLVLQNRADVWAILPAR